MKTLDMYIMYKTSISEKLTTNVTTNVLSVKVGKASELRKEFHLLPKKQGWPKKDIKLKQRKNDVEYDRVHSFPENEISQRKKYYVKCDVEIHRTHAKVYECIGTATSQKQGWQMTFDLIRSC